MRCGKFWSGHGWPARPSAMALQMASLSHHSQFETNLVSNRKVIELLLQLKSARTHDKNYKVRPSLVRHL